jgi:hypothetical protein
MTTLRKVLVSVFLVVFVAAFVLAALGATKRIELADGALAGFFAVLIGQFLTAIVAVFRTPDFFKEDPLSVANLQWRHAEEISQLKQLFAKEVAKMQATHEEDKNLLLQEAHRKWEQMNQFRFKDSDGKK